MLSVCLLTATLQAQSRESLLKAVGENPDWSAVGTPKQYNQDNIDVLAKKTASSLKRYGLSGVVAQDWNGAQGRVRLTLYEMTDASAAYGFFTLERDVEQAGMSSLPFGTEGFRNGNRTVFWQSKYVVLLEGESKATDNLGHIVAENIFGRSRRPPVSDHLPLNNLIQGSEKYVVDAAGLDPNLSLDGSTLGFDDDVEIATARYRINGKTADLVLLLYPTQQLAKKYSDEWDSASPDEKQFRKRAVRVIAWVRGSHDSSVAQAILNSVGDESKVTWNEPRPDISLKTVILTIFSFIGIALLFTVVAGLSFGGLRVFVKSRFPNRVFDRASDMEIIQLKLDQ